MHVLFAVFFFMKNSFIIVLNIKAKFNHYRYGTGFGIIGPVLGESSMFNVPNSIYGIAFYLLTMALGIT